MAVLNHLLLRGKGGGRGKGGEMTQILYAHMNKRNNKKLEGQFCFRFCSSL
jgi:hypothetical protein